MAEYLEAAWKIAGETHTDLDALGNKAAILDQTGVSPELMQAALEFTVDSLQEGVVRFQIFIRDAVELMGVPLVRKTSGVLQRAWNNIRAEYDTDMDEAGDVGPIVDAIEKADAFHEFNDVLKETSINEPLNPKVALAAAKLLVRVTNLGVVKFADMVARGVEVIGHETIQRAAPYLKSGWRQLRTRPGFESLDEAGSVLDSLSRREGPTASEPDRRAKHFSDRLLAGEKYENISKARQEAAEILGRPVESRTAEAKLELVNTWQELSGVASDHQKRDWPLPCKELLAFRPGDEGTEVPLLPEDADRLEWETYLDRLQSRTAWLEEIAKDRVALRQAFVRMWFQKAGQHLIVQSLEKQVVSPDFLEVLRQNKVNREMFPRKPKLSPAAVELIQMTSAQDWLTQLLPCREW